MASWMTRRVDYGFLNSIVFDQQVKRTIAFPTRFVRTVDELEMEVVRMARLHQRELKTLKAQLGNRPQDSGDGGDLFREDAIDADGDGIPDDDDQPDKSPGKGDGGDGTTRMEALTLQLHARNETIREVLKQKEDLYKQVHDLKLLEEKLSRTKIKYKMSQDMVAQLQQQLMNATQEVRGTFELFAWHRACRCRFQHPVCFCSATMQPILSNVWR